MQERQAMLKQMEQCKVLHIHNFLYLLRPFLVDSNNLNILAPILLKSRGDLTRNEPST